ncbi:beta-galactosidase [Bacteroidia bacterium]|nr:beta-galactosidase [Bacteroidia bacterium]
MNTHFKQFAAILSMLLLIACNQSADTVSLAGEWQFRLDPEDAGLKEEWNKNAFAERIHLPGSLQEQGFGNDVDVNTQWTGGIVDRSWYDAPQYAKYREKGNIKVPFWLNPDKHYVGVAWYKREVNIPGDWAKGKSVWVELERTHWETTLFVDGKEIGSLNSLSTPHRYELKGIEPGKHTLSIRVDNRVHIPVGINAHSVSDHTQSNWNGLTGNLTLVAKPSVHIDDVQVYPNVTKKNAGFHISLKGGGTPGNGTIRIQLETLSGQSAGQPVTIDFDTQKENLDFKGTIEGAGDIRLWTEFNPNLYRLKTSVTVKGETDVRYTQFGFREFKKEGTRFQVNGQPVFLRGTLECCIFPLTGYPAMDKSYWAKIYGAAKSFGLNHLRFHSWCPPEAAFEVADSMGVYLQVECAAWTRVGDGSVLDRWIYDESDRILKEYGNHPSFTMLLYGNEPSGKNQVDYFNKLVDYWKEKDPRRVYSSAAGWPYVENADFWNTPDPRIQAWGGGLHSVINAQQPRTDYDWREIIKKDMPTVSHEIGQWCVYPNFEEIKKYTGVLKAKNFEIFKDMLEASHLGDLSSEFLYASGKLQTLCYKADIEAALRTPGFAGFQLLDLHDFPGQGTALVGVLDAFWDTKGYVTGEEYSRFCNQTVPLIRFPKLIWQNNETLKATLEVAHFGGEPLAGARFVWTAIDSKKRLVASGSFDKKDIPLDNCTEVGSVELPLNTVEQAEQFTISVAIEGTPFQNQWNIWVYPAKKAEVKAQPFIAAKWNAGIIDRLNKGESVLLTLPKGSIRPEKGGNIAVGFSSIFWNTAWTRGQAPHTLGVYCAANHPALASFPNEGFSDYQWWDIVANCEAIDMSDFPAGYRPVVHLIDDWFKARKLGLLFEAKVGNGKLVVCSADLQKDLSARPAAAQFRQSILEYMASGSFNPSTTLEPSVISKLFTE